MNCATVDYTLECGAQFKMKKEMVRDMIIYPRV